MRDNKILEVTNCDLAVIGAELIDAKGMYVVPGGVEIHCHGGGGGDFMEGTEEAFRTAINAHMKHGTTSIFPTLSSSTIPMIACSRRNYREDDGGTGQPGIRTSSGRTLSQYEAMAGGQIPENIKNPDPEEYIPLLEETRLYQALGCCARTCREPCSSVNTSRRKGVLASVGTYAGGI